MLKVELYLPILFGLSFGISWTPCVGTILVSILILASSQNSIFLGGLLLFIYGVGFKYSSNFSFILFKKK